MKVNRWLGVGSGMMIMCIAGTIYLYPNYSTALRSQLRYTIQQSDLVGTLLNLGAWMTVIGGLFYDRFGPLATGMIGSTMVVLGYMLMYLGTKGDIPHHYAAMGIYALIMGQGSGWLYTTALNTSVLNFSSRDRGKVVGLLACCFGLCAGIFTRMHAGFYAESTAGNGGDVAPFLLFLALATGGVGLSGTLCQQLLFKAHGLTPPPAEKKRIVIAYIIAMCMALYVGGSSLATTFTNVSATALAWGLLALIATLLLLPLGSGPYISINDKQYTLVADDVGSTSTNAEIEYHDKGVKDDRSYTLKTACMSLDFWLIFMIFFLGVGSGICVVNNLPEIVTSRIGDDYTNTTIASKEMPHSKDQSSFLALFSVFNTFGRLLSGYLSDTFAHRISRFGFLVLTSLLMATAQVFFAFASINAMYGGIIILGLAYGSYFCLLPTVVSEAFGLEIFGATFGLQGLAPAMGSEVFATALAGRFADEFKDERNVIVISAGGDHTSHCLGHKCYFLSLLITTGASVLAALTALWLVQRQRSGAANTKKLN